MTHEKEEGGFTAGVQIGADNLEGVSAADDAEFMPYQQQAEQAERPERPVQGPDNTSRSDHPIERVVRKAYDDLGPRTPQVVLPESERDAEKAYQSIEYCIRTHNRLEEFHNKGKVGKLAMKYRQQAPEVSREQLLVRMQDALRHFVNLKPTLLQENERQRDHYRRNQEHLQQEIMQYARQLTPLEQEVSELDQRMSDLHNELAAYRGKPMDFSQPEEVDRYYTLRRDLQQVKGQALEKAHDYMTTLEKLRENHHFMEENEYLSAICEKQNLDIRQQCQWAESLLKELEQYGENYRNLARNTQVINRLREGLGKVKGFVDNSYIEDMNSLQQLQERTKASKQEKEKSYVERKRHMEGLMENIQKNYEDIFQEGNGLQMRYD